MLQFRTLIIVPFLILFCSNVYSQVSKFDDDLFLITRDYAEFIAARFDSLEAFKQSYHSAVNKLDTCATLLEKYDSLNTKHKQNAEILHERIRTQSEIIQTYKLTDEINNDLQKRLKIETRKRKAWKATAITAIIFSGAAVLFIVI